MAGGYGNKNYDYLKNEYTYDGNLDDFIKENPGATGRNLVIPKDIPVGGKYLNGLKNAFEGFEKGQPIVSPATAKVLEIGTVTVDNETSEKFMSSFYTSEEEGYSEEDENTANKKTFVTEDQYTVLETASTDKESDDTSPFGKSYTTGYVKLEIIGTETLEKFKALGLDQYYEGLNAFYEEYYNKANNRSVCDSYIIYIEGIDLTGDLEDEASAGLNADLSNTILAGLFNANNTAGATFEVATDSNIATDKEEPEAVNEIEINYYTPREAPKYYTNNAKLKLEQKEEKKQSLPSIIKLKNNTGKGNNAEEFYVKAGTTLGITGDANIKIIMKNQKNEIVENVDEYLEIEEDFEYSNSTKANGKGAEELSALTASSSTSEKVIAMIDFLMDNGFTFEAACGVVGNGVQESGLDPTYSHYNGYNGMFMTLDSTWVGCEAWMKSQGYDPFSIEGQMHMLLEYPNLLDDRSYWGNVDEMKGITDIDDATDYWCVFYEGCWGGNQIPENISKYGPMRSSDSRAKYYQELGLRKNYAKQAADIYNGSETEFHR